MARGAGSRCRLGRRRRPTASSVIHARHAILRFPSPPPYNPHRERPDPAGDAGRAGPAPSRGPGSGSRPRRRPGDRLWSALPIAHVEDPPITSELLAFIGLGIALAVAAAAVVYARRDIAATRATQLAEEERLREERSTAEQERKAIILAAKEEALRLRAEADADVRERRGEIVRREQRAVQHEESLERRRREVEAGEQRLERREAELSRLRSEIDEKRSSVTAELERIAALTRQEARGEVLSAVEGELSGEIAKRIRAADERVRQEADERSREILVATMQRHASDQTGEASITVMQLPSDDLKGRIIGREGRNIRALESATGVDIIIDDTPEAIILSGFDPVRREVARLTLDRLLADGRIHPARIEELAAKTRSEMGQRIREEGEQACAELGISGVHPELTRLLGTLHYRTSYGHNVLAHSKETAAIAGMLAAEIGSDEQEAREIGLFHDIGKAAAHEVEGSHAVIGGEILARLGRPPSVVHAVRAHHYDEEPASPAAFILMTADAISAGRRGARREALSASIKRIERLETIANSFEGVERSFAVQSGKEVRVMVRPAQVDDDRATVLARQIARRIHSEGTYAGRIKVVVLRETRSVEYAK